MFVLVRHCLHIKEHQDRNARNLKRHFVKFQLHNNSDIKKIQEYHLLLTLFGPLIIRLYIIVLKSNINEVMTLTLPGELVHAPSF